MNGKSVSKVAAFHGLSVPHVNRILDQQKVDRSKRLKAAQDTKVIDHQHEKVGQRLYHYRQFEVFEDRSACAEALGWSAKKVAMIEQGHSVLNFSDLLSIAEYMKKTVSELLIDI